MTSGLVMAEGLHTSSTRNRLENRSVSLNVKAMAQLDIKVHDVNFDIYNGT